MKAINWNKGVDYKSLPETDRTCQCEPDGMCDNCVVGLVRDSYEAGRQDMARECVAILQEEKDEITQDFSFEDVERLIQAIEALCPEKEGEK